ncbi:MAG: nucleotidyltransferase family protein [Gemmatimonadales bacterium]
MPPDPVRALLDRLRLGAGTSTEVPESLLPLIRFEGAGAWLARRARQGAPLGPIAERLREDARAAALATLRRDEEVARIAARFEAGGFPYVLLKGAARSALAAEIPLLDARPSVDIDVLLAPGAARPAWEALRADGYRVAAVAPPGHHHLDNLAGELGVGIEIHETTARTVPPEVAWERLGRPARTVTWQGRQVRVPPPVELAWHQIQHALLDGPDGFRLRHFLPVAAVAAAGADDWPLWDRRLSLGESVDDRTRRPVAAATGRRWLEAARWLAGLEGGSAAALHRVLRWRLACLQRGGPQSRGLAGRAFAEGPRVELGLAAEPSLAGTPWWPRVRREAAARAVRAAYHAYRLTAAAPR